MNHDSNQLIKYKERIEKLEQRIQILEEEKSEY